MDLAPRLERAFPPYPQKRQTYLFGALVLENVLG